MNEMDVLQRLRDEVPASLPLTRAAAALSKAIVAEAAAPAAPVRRFVPAKPAHAGRRASRPSSQPFRLAMAGGVSLTLAAGIAAAVVLSGSGLHGAKPLTVHELAYRAAAAASAQGNVPANHWVYWR
ncbi:MAG: hypothetical protein ACTHJW_09775, partial [Streptosporangiaceae bacterium]